MSTVITKQKFNLFSDFVGPEVMRIMYGAIAVGIFLFAVEYSFIFVLQGFLFAIGIMPAASVNLPDWFPTSVVAALLTLAVFGCLRAVGYFFKCYLTQMSVNAYIKNKRAKIVNYSLTHALELSTNEVVDMFSETTVRSGNIMQSIATLVLSITTSSFLFIFGLKIAPIEMLLGVLLLGLLSLPMRKFEKNVSMSAEGVRSEWVQVNSTLLNGIKNNFFLKIYGLVGEEEKKASQNLDRFYEHQKTYTLTYAAKLALPLAIGVFVISIVSYVSVLHIKTPAIMLLSFFYIFIRFVQSASEVLTGLGEIKVLLPNLKTLYRWENKLALLNNAKQQGLIKQVQNEAFTESITQNGATLLVKNMSFKYDQTEKWVIKNLSVSLSKGRCLVISGESGSGKSTLLSLLLGINTPTEGAILINDFEINEVREELFNHIGYVGPDPYLISGTIKENLLYGHPKSSQILDVDIADALKKANAYEFVCSMPDKENTFLNEFAKISTGQKQRLAIARVLLRKPVLLIADECTSNLDSFNEGEIIKTLFNIKNQMTMIVVTHRPAFKVLSDVSIDLNANEVFAPL